MVGPERTPGRSLEPRHLRWGVAIVAVVVIGVGAWLLLGDDADETGPGVDPPAAEVVSGADLKALAASREEPVFWAGPQPGTVYELTATPDGTTHVRYLPRGVEVGDPRPAFLTVSTYSIPDGYSLVRAAAREPGATKRELPREGLMVISAASPSNVHVGYRGGPYQVEVYDPSPRRARDLVISGQVRLVR